MKLMKRLLCIERCLSCKFKFNLSCKFRPIGKYMSMNGYRNTANEPRVISCYSQIYTHFPFERLNRYLYRNSIICQKSYKKAIKPSLDKFMSITQNEKKWIRMKWRSLPDEEVVQNAALKNNELSKKWAGNWSPHIKDNCMRKSARRSSVWLKNAASRTREIWSRLQKKLIKIFFKKEIYAENLPLSTFFLILTCLKGIFFNW